MYCFNLITKKQKKLLQNNWNGLYTSKLIFYSVHHHHSVQFLLLLNIDLPQMYQFPLFFFIVQFMAYVLSVSTPRFFLFIGYSLSCVILVLICDLRHPLLQIFYVFLHFSSCPSKCYRMREIQVHEPLYHLNFLKFVRATFFIVLSKFCPSFQRRLNFIGTISPSSYCDLEVKLLSDQPFVKESTQITLFHLITLNIWNTALTLGHPTF